MTRHLWITADSAVPALALVARIDAHRRIRGPYSAAGSLARALVPGALQRWPEIVERHDVEVLCVAPELRGVLSCSRETLTSLAPPAERTRFYPPARTQRIAHGLTEMVRDIVRAEGGLRPALVIERVDEAGVPDAEWIATMLRRIDPALLQLVVCSETELAEDGVLGAALRRYAEPHVLPAAPRPAQTGDPARRYVELDCTSSDAAARAAYEALPAAERAALHDARAAQLEQRGELSLALGAVPLHRERGSDPRGAGAKALLAALQHCMLEGFYDAVLDLAHRCYAVLDWTEQPEECWRVTSKLTMALAAMGRADEAAVLYDGACMQTTLPKIHLHAAYGRSMLYTRFYPAERRDRRKAKAWINTAIALSSQLPDAQRRAFDLSFNENGLALIEMYLGDAERALALVNGGLDRVEADPQDDQLLLHRSVLRYNRAQLLSRMGRPEEALAAYSEAIDADPNQSEYHLERGSLLRRLGRPEEARADFEAAIRTSPPYPEPHYALADLLLELGDVETALARLSYALELDPAFADARVARVSLLFECGELDAAGADAEAGLALHPGNAELHALSASIAHGQQRVDDAHEAFAEALRLDPTLAAAWSNRATLWYEQGRLDRAIEDLENALDLDDDPDIRANLEFVTAAAAGAREPTTGG